MQTLVIKKDGGLVPRGGNPKGDALGFLSHTVSLEQGVTLASFFELVVRYPSLKPISPFLDTFVAMAENTRDTLEKTSEIEHLVFYKTIAMKGFPGKPGVDIFNSLKGSKKDGRVALKFFHLETLLNHNIVLGDLKHVIFGDTQETFTYTTTYSLFELIEGITWELSFNFNPLHCAIRG